MNLQFGALRLVCSCGSDDVLAMAPGTRGTKRQPEQPTRAWCHQCWAAQFACAEVAEAAL